MKHTSVSELIKEWPSRADLAADLESITGKPVAVDRIHKWVQSDAIPAWFHAHVVRAGMMRGIDIDFEQMAILHAVPPVGVSGEVTQ